MHVPSSRLFRYHDGFRYCDDGPRYCGDGLRCDDGFRCDDGHRFWADRNRNCGHLQRSGGSGGSKYRGLCDFHHLRFTHELVILQPFHSGVRALSTSKSRTTAGVGRDCGCGVSTL